ncbi:MAG: PQQ-binding-like beta-propeller repeat protein [Pirellulales bacterium]
MARSLLAALLLGCCSLALWSPLPYPQAAAGDWPQWRGPTRDGQDPGPSWPDSLQAPHLEQQWRVELGPSYSGPIVSGNRVFTTETVDRQREVVRAYDRQTGNLLWQVSWDGAVSVPFFAKSNGDWIRSTPACDGERLYVAGMRDLLVCLRAADGQELWRYDFVAQDKSPLPPFGFVCSPLVHDGAVYVQAGGGLVKLDAQRGTVLWKSLADGGGMEGSAFSSPILTEVGGRRQLVVQTRQRLAGVEPERGEVLWSQDVPSFRGMNILTPLQVGSLFFTSAYGGKSFGYAVQPEADRFTVQTSWENKVQGYMSTPVAIQGHAYLHLRNQRFTCLDLQTGAEKWTTPKTFGKYWSLVAQGERLLALDERGELLLIQADPREFRLLDQRRISEQETWAHLAISDGQLFVRELNALSAYRWEKK